MLHCVCSGSAADQSYAQKLRRDECLLLVLQWNGARLADGSMERVDLVAKDEVNLHFVLVLSCYVVPVLWSVDPNTASLACFRDKNQLWMSCFLLCCSTYLEPYIYYY